MACRTAWFGKLSPSRMPSLGFSLGLDVGTTSHQCCASCTGFQSRDKWRALPSRLCLARHLHTWLMTYTWSQKVLDVGCVRLPTDRMLFHAATTRWATEVLLSPSHTCGTTSQYTYATKTSFTEHLGMNLKCTCFNVSDRGAMWHLF